MNDSDKAAATPLEYLAGLRSGQASFDGERSLLNAAIKELRFALCESVRLQTHYARLLNMLDDGERREFLTAEEWMARLRELDLLPI